jgi:hypothetical protein
MDTVTKIDDASIRVVSTTTTVIAIDDLIRQQDNLKKQVDFFQSKLDEVTAQLQQAAKAGVAAAVKSMEIS